MDKAWTALAKWLVVTGQGLNPILKDSVQLAAWAAAVIGAIIAVSKAINESRLNRVQRTEEQKWRKANLAREIFAAFRSNALFRDALKMLDWTGREYLVTTDRKETVNWGELMIALRPHDVGHTTFSTKEVYIRDCFDAFFEALEDLEYYLRIELLNFADVELPIKYYIGKVCQEAWRSQMFGFMRHYGYDLAEAFTQRFPGSMSTQRETYVAPTTK